MDCSAEEGPSRPRHGQLPVTFTALAANSAPSFDESVHVASAAMFVASHQSPWNTIFMSASRLHRIGVAPLPYIAALPDKSTHSDCDRLSTITESAASSVMKPS